jgi:hypothetical protein
MRRFARKRPNCCAAANVATGQQATSKTDANQSVGFASLMLGFIAPLPFQPSPRSSSKAKQLG